MMSYVWREFSSVGWKMMKEDLGVSNAQAWGCHHAPPINLQGYSSVQAWGCPRIPFYINNHQFILLLTIFISLHVLCAMLGASCNYFLVCLVLLAVHNKLEPNLHCLGEKHTPLHPITQYRFRSYLWCVFFIFFVDIIMFSSCFQAYLFKGYI